MNDGQRRKEMIIAALKEAEKPISAQKFAKELGVSRQIIVGDVALLRASGQQIMATARGYLLAGDESGTTAKIAVQHGPDQTEEELNIIVANGGEILDVIVEHPLYGELQGNLQIKTFADVRRFIADYQKAEATLLSELTEGIHLHTIRFQTEADLVKIKQALQEQQILYQEK
ncbi:transcription repressor NadR [Enterococcus sp. HY326]|uniref:transcription repressor NadR n=1 Tax=Enterococcus sp. HY326 TaxID=2971265 RepID=UPI00223F9A2E|nr:transcription repressor NadR [Enterococcus sp. HY326]